MTPFVLSWKEYLAVNEDDVEPNSRPDAANGMALTSPGDDVSDLLLHRSQIFLRVKVCRVWCSELNRRYQFQNWFSTVELLERGGFMVFDLEV